MQTLSLRRIVAGDRIKRNDKSIFIIADALQIVSRMPALTPFHHRAFHVSGIDFSLR